MSRRWWPCWARRASVTLLLACSPDPSGSDTETLEATDGRPGSGSGCGGAGASASNVSTSKGAGGIGSANGESSAEVGGSGGALPVAVDAGGDAGGQGATTGAAQPGSSYFVAVGGAGRRSASPDGKDWSVEVADDAAVSLLRGVAWADGTFVAVGDCDGGGCALRSRDARNWVVTGRFPSFASHAAHGQAVWVTVGGNGERYFSEDDADSWQPVGEFVSGHFRDIAAGPEGFVAVGHSYEGEGEGMIATSSDGRSWSAPAVGGDALYAVTYAMDRYVAVGAAGRVSTSFDAVEWRTQRLGSGDLSDVAYGGGIFVVVGGGQGYFSPDASGFQPVGYAPDHVVFGDGLFVGVGDSRRFISLDGLEWGQPTQSGGDGYSDVAFGWADG